MANVPVFIHTRPDVEADTHHSIVLLNEQRSTSLTPKAYVVTRIMLPHMDSLPFVTGSDARVLPEVDSVLMSLIVERCEPSSLCIIMAHNDGDVYTERDFVMMMNLSQSFDFSFEDVTIYPVEDLRVGNGSDFNQYFSAFMES